MNMDAKTVNIVVGNKGESNLQSARFLSLTLDTLAENWLRRPELPQGRTGRYQHYFPGVPFSEKVIF